MNCITYFVQASMENDEEREEEVHIFLKISKRN